MRPFLRPFRLLLYPVFGTILRVNTDATLFSLTFDDGPHPIHTPKVLDLLGRFGARATFFLVGEAAARRPDLVDRIRAEGHEVACHSWDHPSFPFIPRTRRKCQIQRWKQQVWDGAGPLTFRFPWGHQTPLTRFEMAIWRCKVIGWDVDPGDYLPGRSREELAQTLHDSVRPGSIVLLHDALHDDWERPRDETLGALESFLGPTGPGLRSVPVSELTEHGTPVRIHAFFRPEEDPSARRRSRHT